jgi:hypothetical protein
MNNETCLPAGRSEKVEMTTGQVRRQQAISPAYRLLCRISQKIKKISKRIFDIKYFYNFRINCIKTQA